MSEGTRQFDPEAVQEFIDFLKDQIDVIENDIAHGTFRNGDLKRMPAFGTGGGETLALNYQRFHAEVWASLHIVRANYLGFINALEASIEANEASEAANTRDFDGLS